MDPNYGKIYLYNNDLCNNIYMYASVLGYNNNFYSTKNGFNECYDNKTKSYIKIPGQEGFIILKNTTDDKVIWSKTTTT